jgi:hypothetical protein
MTNNVDKLPAFVVFDNMGNTIGVIWNTGSGKWRAMSDHGCIGLFGSESAATNWLAQIK